jgi:phosphatidylinositol alpha-1,6-mannosyltransferase
VPYGVYFHGTEILTELRSRLRRGILAKVIRSAAVVASNSGNTAKLLREHFDVQNVQVILPGVNPDLFREPATREHARELKRSWVQQFHPHRTIEDPVILLSMCRLAKGKGLDLVLMALAQVRSAEPDLEFIYIITGDGPEREHLEITAQQLGLRNHVQFVGPVPHESAPAYYCASDIYVQPSQPHGDFLESFGISFLEAQAAGLPCIGSDWGGVREAVDTGRTALLVPIGRIDAIRDALGTLMLDETRRARMGGEGREFAASRTWSQHTEKLSRILIESRAQSR